MVSKPLPISGVEWAMGSDYQPEFGRVIRFDEMGQLVHNNIIQDLGRCHYEPPIERKISFSGTVSPLCPLAHNVNAIGPPSNFHGSFSHNSSAFKAVWGEPVGDFTYTTPESYSTDDDRGARGELISFTRTCLPLSKKPLESDSDRLREPLLFTNASCSITQSEFLFSTSSARTSARLAGKIT